MFIVHASLVALTQASITGQRFFCPLDTHSVTSLLLCNCCLPSHTHLLGKPFSTEHCVPAPAWAAACPSWISSVSLFLRQCSLCLDPVEWSSGLYDIRCQEGLWDSWLARSCILLLQYLWQFYWWFFFPPPRNLYFSNSGLQIRNMFHV
jgi:hypothetical protein